MDGRELMQIGEVAERAGLSMRTIRYYEEVGLVVPTARSQGGFRLYTESDVQRLQLIRRMRPLEFTLEQTRELLQLVDRLADGTRLPGPERARLVTSLQDYREAIRARCEALREQLATAETFDATLAEHLDALDTRPAAAARH